MVAYNNVIKKVKARFKYLILNRPFVRKLVEYEANMLSLKIFFQEVKCLNDAVSEEFKIISLNNNTQKGQIPIVQHLSMLNYANKYKDKECVIIGNGPSVSISDLNQLSLKKITTFACNKFYLSYCDHQLRPDFTIACDQQVISDFGFDIAEKSQPSTVCFACDQGSKFNYSGFIRVLRRETFGSEILFCKTPLFGVPSMGSVVIFGIQLAYYMGFSTIYLYGVDHDFKVEIDPDAKDPWRSAVNEGNHFIKNYRQGARWAPPATDLIENGFLLCQKEFEADSRKLYNVSRRTKLPYVKRLDFDELFGGKKDLS